MVSHSLSKTPSYCGSWCSANHNNDGSFLISSNHTSTSTTSFLNLLQQCSPPSHTSQVPEFTPLTPLVSNESEEIEKEEPGLTKGFRVITNQFPLPVEVLYQIIEQVYYTDTNEIVSFSDNLDSFAHSIVPVCKIFRYLAAHLLYRYALFTRPHSFDTFLTNLKNDTLLGLNVEFLDFMEFTSIGLGRTNKMNEEIQMLTSNTILQCLHYTPNLLEFLASENIEGDIDSRVLSYLFNNLIYLQGLDFCGAGGNKFLQAFQQLEIQRPVIFNITKISFHDCTNLPNDVFIKILPKLVNLNRLDLTHTQISSNTLNNYLPSQARLTHLSLARCSKITTRDLIDFLLYHDSVGSGSLRWLNLQVDTSVVSPLNEVQLSYLLRNLNAPDLQYLNLNGSPVNMTHLEIIKTKFKNLQSLSIAHSHIPLEELIKFFKGDGYSSIYPYDSLSLRFLDITGNKAVTRSSIERSNILSACPTLQAVEVNYAIVQDIKSTCRKIVSQADIWKCYDNSQVGRRGWLFKLSETEAAKERKGESVDYDNNLTFYDLKTGKKITKKLKPPEFLKLASRKISCSMGPFARSHIDNGVFPAEFSQRGMYRYYSLNK